MILRLDYLLILYSGGSLLGTYIKMSAMSGEVVLKVLAGLWAIVAIELITIKAKKAKPQKAWWIQFAIAALIAIVLGFGRLPLGILP